jgi:queuosine precursor transporter
MLWLRTIGSTVVGQGLDSLVFILIVFWGVMPPPALIATLLMQWLFKVVYEVLATPFTYVVVNFLKHQERSNVFGHNTTLNPLALGE